jgi:hypothetical protein
MADKRLLDDWLSGYLEYTAQQESPESLHLWTALTIVSAALRRRVFIEHEYYKIYPNVYVIIVAESAKVRKSTAMDLGRDLLVDAVPEIKIMRDSMTSQGLIKALNKKTQVVTDGKISEELRSDVAIFADEVANLFSYDKTRSSQMVIFLTRSYSCPAIYDHTTARDSTVRLHNLYPVFLGGTDPHNLKVLPPDAVGGLTGRLIWVIERERRHNNPGWKRDNVEATRRKLIREMLVHDLQRIANLEGEMTATEEAMAYYDNWYEALSSRGNSDQNTDAFYQRCHTTALRLGMLRSISEGDSLQLSLSHMKAGITLIEQQLPEMQRVNMWAGSSNFEVLRAKYVSFLINVKDHLTTRSILLKHMGVMSDEFDKISYTLIQDGTITISDIKVKGQTIIKLVATNGSTPE